MQIDTKHIHHWMRAIRNSKDPIRTMDAFWKGQISSKEWLIDSLKKHKTHHKAWPNIDIHGGWVGVLASMLFQSGIYINHINSIDIDPDCEQIAKDMNQIELEAGKFKAITSDMCVFNSHADVIINTSCEHITQEKYDQWLDLQPNTSLFVLQSNNYVIDEHVRIAETLDEFKTQSHINVLWAGELVLPLYTRWMIIGKKNV